MRRIAYLPLLILLLFFAMRFGLGDVISAETPPAHISDFVSIEPVGKTTGLQMPASHTFQYLAEQGDPHDVGNTAFLDKFDFTGFVPSGGSSVSGTLGLNHETTPGGVSMMDISLDPLSGAWVISNSVAVDFSGVGGTRRNCSGAVTPWETYVSCEEAVSADGNEDGYNDIGWCVEIDPQTRTVIDQDGDFNGGDKLWSIGNFEHENMVVHPNRRTVYTGRDHGTGYLFRFIADQPENLASGDLYVYKATTASTGSWVLLDNDTPAERNSTLAQAAAVGASVYSGIEDVEIGPDGMVYFAAKGNGHVYRLQDDDPLSGTTVSQFETFVGGQSYPITHANGTTMASWGNGNDNLAFDDRGNLWVLQDGGNEYIWVVGPDHTQAEPNVRLFGISPSGSEPTGITFTPDNRYLFMSIQHPSATNAATTQLDAFGVPRAFDKDVAIVIAHRDVMGIPTALDLSMVSAETTLNWQLLTPLTLVVIVTVWLLRRTVLPMVQRP